MIQKFVYKRATMEDIDELVRTRIIVLRAANKLPDDEDMSVVEKESYAYYRRALETGEHIAYLVYDNGAFVGAGGVSFYQVMPTYHNPTGKKAYIATVYKGNIIKNLIMDCQSYTKYRPNETTGGIFVSWRRKEELPTGA